MPKAKLSFLQKTMLEQLYTLNPAFISEYGIKSILNDVPNEKKGYGLRLYIPRNTGAINIDIIYRPGRDLYEIKAYRVNGLEATCEPIADIEDVFFFQLHDRIREILKH